MTMAQNPGIPIITRLIHTSRRVYEGIGMMAETIEKKRQLDEKKEENPPSASAEIRAIPTREIPIKVDRFMVEK